MRVLYIDHTAKMGGGEIALANLLRYIDRTMVDPVAMIFEEGPLVDKISPTIETHVLPLDPTVSSKRKDALGIRSALKIGAVWTIVAHIVKVARFARHKRIDLIHTNSLKADIIGGFAARLAGIPVVWHVRDRIDDDYLPPKVVHVFRFLARIVPAYVIANSEATLTTLRLAERRPSRAIGSGVDIASYPTPLSSTDHPMTVGIVGRLAPWKGQGVFLQAAAKVLLSFPSVRFVLIGGALFQETDFEHQLHALAKSLAIDHAVEFTGFVSDVPRRVMGLTVLVHASITGEPYGQVIIEGMAAGKPVIATNGGGVPEIVEDGVTGLLVPMNEVDAMADAIHLLLSKPELCLEMGRRGRQRVLDRFTIEQTARAVQQVYTEVLSV